MTYSDPLPTIDEPPRKRFPRWIIAVIVAASLVLLCLIGTVVAVATADDKAPTIVVPTTTGTTTGPAATTPVKPSASPPPTTKAAPPPAATVKDGEWQAGTDFPVGRYETTTTSDTCVWQVTTGQAPDVHYVDPGHVGPGHYRFTFAAGQTLHTAGCGTWTKTG